MKERDRLGDLGIDGRIILLVNVQKCKCKVVQCVQMAQDWIRWRHLLNGEQSSVSTVRVELQDSNLSRITEPHLVNSMKVRKQQ